MDTREPLAQPLSTTEVSDLAAVPIIAGPNGPKPKLVPTGKTAVNLASYNFASLSGNERIKQRAVEILRQYGLGSCGPPGLNLYGTLGESTSSFYSSWGLILPCTDVHMNLENDSADFLGADAAILYSQGFSTISLVIPAFCKRGDIIVADLGRKLYLPEGNPNTQIYRSMV